MMLRLVRHEDARDLPLPTYATDGAAGMDVYAAVTLPVSLHPGARATIPLGFAMAVPEGYEAQLRPRSGFARKNGITIVNSPATIDSDYRGQMMVILHNLGNDVFVIERGMRVAQMVIAPVVRVEVEEVETLDETARGEGGFGSTGYGITAVYADPAHVTEAPADPAPPAATEDTAGTEQAGA